MDTLETSNFRQENNVMCFRLTVNHKNVYNSVDKYKRAQHRSKAFIVCGLISIEFKVDINYTNNFKGYWLFNMAKCYDDDTVEYGVRITLPQLKLSDYYISSAGNNARDHLLGAYDSSHTELVFDINVTLNVKISPKFLSLHDDIELTDVELVGDEGSVAVHKVVLACHSPVLMTMLTGEWKETKEGRINVPGMSLQALEQLKSYLYLDNIPNAAPDIEPLLDFACRYLMMDLMQLCSTKILFCVTSENAMHYLELAIKYKLKKLLHGIMTMNEEHNFHLPTLISSYCGNGWMS